MYIITLNTFQWKYYQQMQFSLIKHNVKHCFIAYVYVRNCITWNFLKKQKKSQLLKPILEEHITWVSEFCIILWKPFTFPNTRAILLHCIYFPCIIWVSKYYTFPNFISLIQVLHISVTPQMLHALFNLNKLYTEVCKLTQLPETE